MALNIYVRKIKVIFGRCFVTSYVTRSKPRDFFWRWKDGYAMFYFIWCKNFGSTYIVIVVRSSQSSQIN